VMVVRDGSHGPTQTLRNDASRLLGAKHQQPIPLTHNLKLGNQNSYDPSEIDVEDPSAHVELNELELQEIMSRPMMDRNHALVGNRPQSNRNLLADETLIAQKREKIIEIFK